MIELFEEDVKIFDRQSSKGNQLKWEKDGIWYKADYTGYEGLSEYVISQLLTKSSLNGDSFVLYETERIKYKRAIFNGVKSADFLKEDWQIVTLERLYKSKYNRSLMEDVWHITDITERLKFLVDMVEQLTDLKQFGIYMSRMLTIDAFFLNEDRHMHNVAVLINSEGKAEYCPFFDQGAGLMSDTALEYPMGEDPIIMMDDVKAKTICQSFDDALEAAEKLYGYHLKFSFKKNDVSKLLEELPLYTDEEKRRVETIVFQQMRRYQYLF